MNEHCRIQRTSTRQLRRTRRRRLNVILRTPGAGSLTGNVRRNEVLYSGLFQPGGYPEGWQRVANT